MLINNINLFVEKQEGRGNLNFVLIHNAGGDHNFFKYQIDMLKNYGNVISLDLPGHGKSEVISSYTMFDLSSIIFQICKNLHLDNISLIGLNNGANIAINLLANTNELDIKSLVLIDPPIFMGNKFIDEIKNFIEELDQANYDDFVKDLADALFINTEPASKEIAISAFSKVDKKSLQQIFKSLIDWDSRPDNILKNISYPTLCILTDEHHCSYEKLKQKASHFEIGKVIGSKCWATLEVPQQINAMIERFIKIQN